MYNAENVLFLYKEVEINPSTFLVTSTSRNGIQSLYSILRSYATKVKEKLTIISVIKNYKSVIYISLVIYGRLPLYMIKDFSSK